MQSQALNDWFEARYEEQLARSPMMQTYLGIKDNQDKLDDASQIADDETAALTKAWLEDMRREFDIDRLDAQADSVGNVEDAQAYIARLNASKLYLAQFAEKAQAQYENGVALPKFVYGKISEASRNVISGAPFSEGEDSPIFKDIKGKINALTISQEDKDSLIEDAKDALLSSVQPAYLDLLAMFAALSLTAR